MTDYVLKPCIKCGGQADIIRINEGVADHYIVGCIHNECCPNNIDKLSEHYDFSYEEDAAVWWNTRNEVRQC